MWVEDDLTIPDRPEVYIVGDLIARTQDGKQLPAVAPLAMQSGRQVARNIRLAVEGKAGEPFVYIDQGAMATIGRNRAVAQIGRFRFSGIKHTTSDRLMDGDVRYIPGTNALRVVFISIAGGEYRLEGTTNALVDKPNNRVTFSGAVLTSTQGTGQTLTLTGNISMLPDRPEGC